MPPSIPTASSSKLKSKSSKLGTKASGKVKNAASSNASVTDIDSIFAQPTKAKTVPVQGATSEGPSSSKSKGKKRAIEGDEKPSRDTSVGEKDRKKKKKKSKQEEGDDTESTKDIVPEPTPSRVVEVVDTSIPKVKEPVVAVDVKGKAGKGMTKKQKQEAEEDQMFADSRGTGPRRKTEEGFLIYKELELQIDPEAGGTPLCPFDCDCCF